MRSDIGGFPVFRAYFKNTSIKPMARASQDGFVVLYAAIYCMSQEILFYIMA